MSLVARLLLKASQPTSLELKDEQAFQIFKIFVPPGLTILNNPSSVEHINE
jgi:hypothetical protein